MLPGVQVNSLGLKGPWGGGASSSALTAQVPVRCRMEGARAALSALGSPVSALPPPQPLTSGFPEQSQQNGSDLAKATLSPVLSAIRSVLCLAWF